MHFGAFILVNKFEIISNICKSIYVSVFAEDRLSLSFLGCCCIIFVLTLTKNANNLLKLTFYILSGFAFPFWEPQQLQQQKELHRNPFVYLNLLPVLLLPASVFVSISVCSFSCAFSDFCVFVI